MAVFDALEVLRVAQGLDQHYPRRIQRSARDYRIDSETQSRWRSITPALREPEAQAQGDLSKEPRARLPLGCRAPLGQFGRSGVGPNFVIIG